MGREFEAPDVWSLNYRVCWLRGLESARRQGPHPVGVKGGKEAEHEPSKHKSRAGPQLPVLKGGAVKRYLSFVSVCFYIFLFVFGFQ